LKKYGKGRERKTQIASFDAIVAQKVVAINSKLFVNRGEGFAGFGLKKDEFVADCSKLDDVLAISSEGKFMVSRIADKKYFGKEILHINIFQKNDNNTIFNMIYQDGPRGSVMVKRFYISGVTREKFYDLTRGSDKSKVLYLSISDKKNAPEVEVVLRPRPKLRNKILKIDFNDIAIKNRSAGGNVITKFAVSKIKVLASSTTKKKIESKSPAKKSLKKVQAKLDF
jgi:topoisomerase IV subunit A